MRLAVVIVHYNTSADLARCLDSLAAHPPACDHAVVVVDNASTDPGLAEVRERHPEAHWLVNAENVGYARGANRGLAAVRAEHYLILNPDVTVLPGSLDRLLDFADEHPKTGIVGPQLLNEDGSIQDSCRRFYTFGTLLLRRTFLGRLRPDSRTVARHLMRDFDHRSPRPVDWVLGGCLLVRRAALETVGPMDERFFLYFEDVDWCYRMWQGGWEVFYAPEARFVHRHRRESARGALHRGFWRHLGSLISFYEKWSLVVYLLKKWRGPVSLLILWLLDVIALVAAFLGAWGLRALADPLFAAPVYPLAEYGSLLLFALLLATVTFLVSGRYRPGRGRGPGGAAAHLRLVGVVGLLLLASTFLSHQEVYSRAVLLMFLPLYALTSGLVGDLFRALRRRMERGWLSLERTLLVGEPRALAAWLGRLPNPRREGLDPVGYVTAGPEPGPPLGGGAVPWLGPWSELEALVERYRIGQVVFWQQPGREPPQQRRLARLRARRIRLRWRIDEAWLVAAGARGESFGGAPSAVLDPVAGADAVGLLRRAAGLAAGLLLWGATLPARLWDAVVGRGRRTTREIACAGPLGEPLRLRLACRGDGRVAPLWRQWPLAAALLAGRVDVAGPRPCPARAGDAADGPAGGFWRAVRRRPGLTGAWADAPSVAGATGGDAAPRVPARRTFSLGAACAALLRQARTLLLDPGGLGRIGPDAPPADSQGAEPSPRREVDD